MYDEYKDRVQFLLIYISEAHPSDGRLGRKNQREGILIPKHLSYEDRVKVCSLAKSNLEIEMPALVDGMDNAVNIAYSAHPDRLYLVDTGGRIAVRGEKGPRGFRPSIENVEKWLKANL